jgi:hypothetical protein
VYPARRRSFPSTFCGLPVLLTPTFSCFDHFSLASSRLHPPSSPYPALLRLLVQPGSSLLTKGAPDTFAAEPRTAFQDKALCERDGASCLLQSRWMEFKIILHRSNYCLVAATNSRCYRLYRLRLTALCSWIHSLVRCACHLLCSICIIILLGSEFAFTLLGQSLFERRLVGEGFCQTSGPTSSIPSFIPHPDSV